MPTSTALSRSGDFGPVSAGVDVLPHTDNLGAHEDHDLLTPILGEEDGLRRVINLGDHGVGVLAQEGSKVLKGHRHRVSKGEGAGAFLPPTPIM